MAVKIDIGEISEGSRQLEILTGPKELGIDEIQIKDKISVTLDVLKTQSQIDLNVMVEGLLKLTCDRCLETYEQPFETAFELVFVQKTKEEIIAQDDYIKAFSPFTKSLDITNDLREYILLAIPMRKVPPEKNEKCSWCGRSNEMWKSDILDLDEDSFS